MFLCPLALRRWMEGSVGGGEVEEDHSYYAADENAFWEGEEKDAEEKEDEDGMFLDEEAVYVKVEVYQEGEEPS